MNPIRHETRQIITLSEMQKQSMPIYDLNIDSLDGKVREQIQVTGTKMPDFTIIQKPNLTKLKWRYEHTRDKRFYRKPGDVYQIFVILRDGTYCRIKTEELTVVQREAWQVHHGRYYVWLGHTLKTDCYR